VSRIPGARLELRTGAPSAGDALLSDAPAVGVLALQGDVVEHVRALAAVGLRPVAVRRTADLAGLAGLVLPGGESTAISRALTRGGLDGPLAAAIGGGTPVLATCAGLILLSEELEGDQLPRPGGLAVRTRRNAYGSQVASFDAAFDVVGVAGGPMRASFIRAPRIEALLSPHVEVLAEVDGHPVAVRQGGILAMSFHPEVSGDLRMHALFAAAILSGAAR